MNSWLTTSHIPGRLNIHADVASRKLTESRVVSPPSLFWLNEQFGPFQIDPFTSYLKSRLPQFLSCGPDPLSTHVDAFTPSWEHFTNYTFPPFCLIGRCIAKMLQGNTHLNLIAPLWQPSLGSTKLLQLLVHQPVLLQAKLFLSWVPDRPYPMQQKLRICFFMLSSNTTRQLAFQRSLPPTFSKDGLRGPSQTWISTHGIGNRSVFNARYISITQLQTS